MTSTVVAAAALGACFAFCVGKVISCFNKKHELKASNDPRLAFGDTSKKKKIEVLVYDPNGNLIIKKWMERPEELHIGKDPHHSFFKGGTMRNQFGHIVGKNIGWYPFDILVLADDEIYDAIKKHYEKLGIWPR